MLNTLVLGKTQVKTTVRYHFTLASMDIIKKMRNKCQDVEK